MNRFIVIGLALVIGQTAPPASWRVFHSKEQGFTVSAPNSPREKTQQLKLENGAADLSLFVWDGLADVTLIVGVTQFPQQAAEGNEEKRLKNAREGAVENSKGKLIHERKIALAGIPGRELWIGTDNDGMVHARFYAVKDRLFQTIAIGPKTAVETKEVDAFLDSFRLKK